MPHLRSRYVQHLLKNGLKHKGIVCLFGHRQVGKTTVLSQLASNYITLDRSSELQHATESPENFLVAHASKQLPLAVDECQLAPQLFPALKEHVRTDKRPGLFLLSGSVRFSSRKAIRESLTGRMLTYELLPFSVSELENKPLNTLVLQLLQRKSFDGLRLRPASTSLNKHTRAVQYLKNGGLPGICFVRNNRDRNNIFQSQLDLILDRDLRLVCDTSLSLDALNNLVRQLALLQNVPLNLSELAKRTRISPPTLRKIITGLESIFFLRIVRCEGTETHPVIFFEDQGEASYLISLRLAGEPTSPTYSNLDLERLAFAHLRIPFAYTTGLSWEVIQYRKRGGAYVPFVFRAEGKTLGFICMQEALPSLGASRSARSFLETYPTAMMVYLHPGKNARVINSQELVLPMQMIL
ncbi:MAG: ATP-binding protein [Deltaproteobacteria bacterium]|nr:ATP-binding protein [Deltaproteobacteria bacterium]